MSITSNTYPERILIVLNADGTLKGAHQHTLTKFSGADIPDRQGDAEPLAAGTLATVLPSTEALLAQIMALESSHAAALAAKDAEHKTETDAIKAERDTALADKATALTEKATAEASLANVQAERDALYAQLHPVDVGGTPILSRRQVRLGLLGAGITTNQVEAVIDAIPDPIQKATAEIYWNDSIEFNRSHPLIKQFAAGLGLTSEQVDTMWQSASSL